MTRPDSSADSGGEETERAPRRCLNPCVAGIFDSSAMTRHRRLLGNVLRNVAAGAERCVNTKRNFALLQNIRSPIALAGFGTGVGNQAHAEGGCG